MHDPRLGRFFAVDPLTANFPHNSPYAFSENRVLDGIELEGLEVVHYMREDKQKKKWNFKAKEVVDGMTSNLNAYVKINENGGREITYKAWDGSASPITFNRYASDEELITHFGGEAYNPLKTLVNNAMNLHSGESDPFVGSHDAVNRSQLDRKDVITGGKMTMAILTLGYGTGALISGEIGLISVGSTVYAGDDVIGIASGAAYDDIDGEYKPLKLAFNNVGGDGGALLYDAGNIFFGSASKFKNLQSLSKGNIGSSLPNQLDNYGLINSLYDSSKDVKKTFKLEDGSK